MKTLLHYLFLLCFNVLLPAVHSHCIKDQQQSLLHFKNSLQFNASYSTKLISWNSSTDCCSWAGVTCSSNGHVVGLDLSNETISGPIPGSFANFSNLRVLDLSWNSISGTVPGFFANFSKLTNLNLSYCELKGTFPKEIFQVPTLQTIDLSRNEELGGSLPEFPKNNGSLRSLILHGTNFSGSLPESIGNLKMLSEIDLSNCNSHGSIPKALANLTQLVSLDMSSNMFNGTIDSIHWENLINLVDFQLKDNLFEESIPSSLFSNVSSYLYSLDLSFNNLEGSIPKSLVNLTQLDNLDMSSNMFEGSIPSSLFSLPLLSQLILSHNHFSGKLTFSNVSSYLYSLDLSFNILEGCFFSGPQQLTNLTYIDLSYKHLLIFSNGSYSPFPALRYLNLASNNLTTFPHWIWSSNQLDTLNLSCNSLVTLEAPLLHSSVETVDLHSNQLQGQIPFVPFATYLDYSRNNFSSIPSNIGHFLMSTQFFSLSSNNLDGLIPVSLCNASNLRILDLSNNSLSGMIPQCLTAIDDLGILNLARNNLTGTISNLEVTEDSSLEVLELGGNQLGGQFPKSLGNCTRLQILNVENNNITDSFPCSLNDITTLRVLVLRSNNFYGGIECLNTNGTALQIIDLAHNNFRGEIQGILWRTSVPEDSETEPVTITCDSRYNRGCYEDNVSKPFFEYDLSTTFTNKGSERDYVVKILSIFTLIDFSCNNFSGPIPSGGSTEEQGWSSDPCNLRNPPLEL